MYCIKPHSCISTYMSEMFKKIFLNVSLYYKTSYKNIYNLKIVVLLFLSWIHHNTLAHPKVCGIVIKLKLELYYNIPPDGKLGNSCSEWCNRVKNGFSSFFILQCIAVFQTSVNFRYKILIFCLFSSMVWNSGINWIINVCSLSLHKHEI